MLAIAGKHEESFVGVDFGSFSGYR